MMPLRVAVVGSRNFAEPDRIRRYIEALPSDATVVSGGAFGVDRIAACFARARGLKVEVFYAKWREHGRSAGPRRNDEMIRTVDEVVAFWDGESPGTKNAIECAVRHHKLYTVIGAVRR